MILLWLVPVIGIIWLAAWHLKARALDCGSSVAARKAAMEELCRRRGAVGVR